jgi:hypothetical protein
VFFAEKVTDAIGRKDEDFASKVKGHQMKVFSASLSPSLSDSNPHEAPSSHDNSEH